MSYQLINTRQENRIFYIELNRPEKRNALNAEMVTELKQAFAEANNDDESRVVILSGAGKAFSAGADLAYIKELQNNTYEENLADSSHLKELFDLIYFHKKVVIARIDGHAIAGGCGLATVCDFLFSVPEAKFGYTEVKIGFVPAIVMVFLIRKIGEAKARELLLSGKLLDAAKMKELGILNEVYKADEIEAKTNEFAIELAKSTSADSIRLTREMMANIQHMELRQAIDYAAEINAKARETEDCKKGIGAFLAKEKIEW